MKRKPLPEELEEFFEMWDSKAMVRMLNIIYELYKIFDVEDAGDEESQNKRLAEAAYLISWFAEFYGGKLVNTNVKFKGLWERMEKVKSDSQ